MVRVRKLVLAIAAASALTSGTAHALGLGEIDLQSSLSQPLVAEIELLEVRDLAQGEVIPSLASPEEFNKAGVDRQYFLTDLKFTPVIKPNGKSVIRITSTKPVREPYVNFLVEVLWPNGRLLREYTLLLDPPMYAPTPVVSSAPRLPVATAPAPRPQTVAPTPRPVTPSASAPVRPAAPVAPAPAAASKIEGDQYKTTSSDTLWEIAQSSRQSGTVHQAMLAILDLNPNAFVGGNINRLKAGQVLRLPDARQIGARSQREALAEIERQNAQWQAARSQPAAVARQLDATGRAAPLEAGAQAPRADSLRLLSGAAGDAVRGSEAGVAGSAGGLADRLALAEEQLATSRRENTELTERLGELQSQLDKLERLLELKNAQLAALQGGAAADGAVVAEQGAALTTLAEADAADAAQTPGAAAADSRGEAQPEPAQPSAPAASAGNAALLDKILADPTLLAAAGGVLALLLALLVNARRRAAAAAAGEGESGLEPAPRIEPALAAVPAAPVVAAPASTALDGEVEQAIAYGRFTQAAELLRQALDADPLRSDLRVQLLEVCAEMGDREGFERQAAELAELGAAGEQVARLRERYPAMQPVAQPAAVPAVAAAVPAVAGLAVAAAAVSPPLVDEPLSLDELGLEMPDAATPVASPGVESPAMQPEDGAADIELSLDDLERSLAELGDDEWSAAAAEPGAGLAFELDARTPGEAAAGDTAVAAGAAPAGFPEALDDGREAAASGTDAFATRAASADGSTPVAAGTAPSAAPSLPSLDELSLEPPALAGNDDLDLPLEADEVTTKLELARVYLEMGDAEGARDILEEVLREGSATQQQEARELIGRIA